MNEGNAITWFEIPANDLDRASRFYETVLDRKLTRETMGAYEMAIFPFARPGVGGCVTKLAGFEPGASGNLVYLDAGAKLDPVLARVGAAGGSVVLPKTALPDDMGVFAHIIDSEGNRVGLHARQ